MSKNAFKNIAVVGFAHFRHGFEHIFANREGATFIAKETEWDKWRPRQRAARVHGYRVVHFFWARITLADFIALKWRQPRLRIILHFIGSDVSLVCAKKRRIWEYRFYHRCGVIFYADHPNLIDELAVHGLHAKLLVLVNRPLQPHPLPMPERFSVIAYVPKGMEDFYHLPDIEAAAVALPDVPFTIWRHDRPFSLPNMHAKPYLADVIEEFGRHSVFVRLTDHDGLPCTLLEALSCGRQVIWSFPHPHCHRARNAAELVATLQALKGKCEINAAGQAYVIEHYSMERVRQNFWRAWEP